MCCAGVMQLFAVVCECKDLLSSAVVRNVVALIHLEDTTW